MKRSEMMAWTGLVGLLLIGVLLLAGGIAYDTTVFWAGMLLAFGQALVVGIAAWGLSLARQRAELEEVAAPSAIEGFRMSISAETNEAARQSARAVGADSGAKVKTLDTSFQRMLVGLSGFGLLVIAAIIAYLIYGVVIWSKQNADQAFPIAGSFAKPVSVDALGLVIGLGTAAAYFLLFWLTRHDPADRAGEGDAAGGNFTLGVGGMIALGAASLIAFLGYPYYSEIAAGIIAALLTLQGLELLVNALRSYSGIEELDQEAVDLQARPLAPMISSVWLGGVRMLLAQSVGLARSRDKGVMARMMPRVIGAVVVIAILVSCFRVVRPGEVAILERFGYVPEKMGANGHKELADGAVLQPGLYFTLPYPMDQLVRIPTAELQLTNVGAELHAPKGTTDGEGGDVDFQFWTFSNQAMNQAETSEDQFVTGDPAPQILETFVTVMWRVRDPAKFYTGLSHSDFFEKNRGETKAVPIYDELVQQSASFAVTRTFAAHTLDEIMIDDRTRVEGSCKAIMQQKLDEAQSGIEIVDLTIKDLHPPFGKGPRRDASGKVLLDPADAYEDVTSKLEQMETLKDQGQASAIQQINIANGAAAGAISEAQSDKYKKIAQAQGDSARIKVIAAGINSSNSADRVQAMTFAERQAMYRTLKDVFAPVRKVLIDPSKAGDVTVYETSGEKVGGGAGPPGRPPG